MSILIKGIDLPEKHYINGYYIKTDGTVMDLNRSKVVGKAIQITDSSEDAIFRQAAIDAICKACSMTEDYHKCDGYPETSVWCDELVALRALPSAHPEPKTGKWIRWYETIETKSSTDYIPHCKCSECGTEYDPHSAQFVKFCNECGARMVGDPDE